MAYLITIETEDLVTCSICYYEYDDDLYSFIAWNIGNSQIGYK